MEKILGIGGSPRKGGNSDILLKHILKGATGQKVSLEEVQLRDYQFQPCIGCERCRKDKLCTGLQDGMQLLYPKIRESRGMVLITPIYSYNITAIMKSFIDRLYSFYNFSDERPGKWSSQLAGQGRKAIIAAIGEQATHEEGGMETTLDTLRRSVVALGYDIIDELPVLGVFAKGKIREHPQVLKHAEELGGKIASLLSA